MPGEDRDFGGYFPWLADVRPAALAGVLALAVFADDDPVEVAGAAVLQRGDGAPEDAGGADVGVLLEGLADGEAEAPEGDVVRDVCGACMSGFESVGKEKGYLARRLSRRRWHRISLASRCRRRGCISRAFCSGRFPSRCG